MKLFLWNDRNWKLVEENMDYDTEDYVVAKKLIVRWLTDPGHQNVHDSIREVLQSFGEIDSVYRVNDELSDGIYAALVSFVHSECAFNVLVASHNEMFISEHLLSVMPADTWQQTDGESDEQMDTCDEGDDKPGINSMTEDLREMSLCQKNLCCENGDEQFEIDFSLGLSLKQIRSRIFSVKSYQKHLILDYGLESDDEESEEENPILHIDKSEFEKRVSKTIAKLGAKKFQALTIRGKDHISMEMLHWLEPLLKRLQVLYIETYSNSQILYALQETCSNLNKLYFSGFKWRGNTWTDIKAFPKLTHFVLKYVQLNIGSVTENGKRFQRFIELNPQLEVLELEPIVDVTIVKSITKHLSNLRSLTITRSDCSESASMLDSLGELKQLSTIVLTTWTVRKGELYLISMCTQRFHALDLVVLIQNYESNIDDDEAFERLADFPVTHHNGCFCAPDTERSLSFGEYLDDVSIPKDQPALVLVVNTNNPIKSKDASLEDEVIDMFEETKKFYPSMAEFQVLPEDDHYTYVHVSNA
ncbi:uncharacterized protein LOC129569452 [Sitodiplosis mosellana]|uniref:uncharacterized protein LOC129569452 n=1 Tax=Sitodiplosis mosellana TaxID=263140 RepID=UPI0024447ACA|nr:uncharacterized protein LOC129569452 [Sitodiplosis mosellana]